MPSVTYDFVPGQTVYVVDNGAVKSGPVVQVQIVVSSSGTTTTYWVNISGTLTAYTSGVYGTCREAAGYQDIVFATDLVATDVAWADAGSPLLARTATVAIDGGSPVVSLSYSGASVTYQDLVDLLNASLTGLATAAIVDNAIRITSLTKGASSSVSIADTQIGSPLTTKLFAGVNSFTGIAAAVAGTDPGALEALGDSIC